eukprot:2125897-Lingulodinium_polyedra.AAC.1
MQRDGWRPGQPAPEWLARLERGSRVFIRYPEEDLWHERLLCERLGPSRWVVAALSSDVYDEE